MPLWKKFIFAVITTAIFFLALEGILFLLGVAPVPSSATEPSRPVRETASQLRVLVTFLLAFVCAALVGVRVAAPVLTFVYLRWGAGERWSVCAGATGLMLVLTEGVLVTLLQLPLPGGLLWSWRESWAIASSGGGQ